MSFVFCGFASLAVDNHAVLVWSYFGQPLRTHLSMDSTRDLGGWGGVGWAESFFLWLALGKYLVEEEVQTKNSDMILDYSWLSAVRASSTSLSLSPQRF